MAIYRSPMDIIYDVNGQPCGGLGCQKLTTFLGCLARSGQFFPISTGIWTDMDETNIERAWEEITKRFKVDHPNAKAKIMAILNGRWKEWKHNLKSEFFVAGDRATSKSKIVGDSRVKPTQWAVLVDFWPSEDSQKIAEQNRQCEKEKYWTYFGYQIMCKEET